MNPALPMSEQLIAMSKENDALTDENRRLRDVMQRALNRYDREDKGGLTVRDGLTWAMADDLRKALQGDRKP